jgi:hypothetical protein
VAHEREEHHVNKTELRRLERSIGGYRSGLEKLVKKRIDKELIPIWKQPGWTTPAEFRMMLTLVNQLNAQVEALDGLQNEVAELAGLVELRG